MPAPELKKIESVESSEPEIIENWEKLEEKEGSETALEELDFRTAAFIKEHIDIPNLGDFNPEEEMVNIRKAAILVPPGEQSIQRILSYEQFKNKLKSFRENLAKGQLELENVIRQNPDISGEKLDEEIDKICQRLQLSSQTNNFLRAADKYRWAHKEINEKIAEFKNKFGGKWPDELFSALFGRLPDGPIKVEVMPMAVYFKIYDLADYVLAFGGNEMVARSSGGAQLGRKMPIEAFTKKTLIENSSTVEKNYGSAVNRVAIHEEEHAIHKLYPTESFIKEESRVLNFFQKNKEISLQSLKEALTHLARWQIGVWQKEAKTETLSYLKDGRSTIGILNALLDESGDALYYFLRNLDSDTYVASVVVDHFRKMDPQITYESGKVLSEDEVRKLAADAVVKGWDIYKDSVKKALEIVGWLLTKYGRDQTLRILAQEPLGKWHRLRRILS